MSSILARHLPLPVYNAVSPPLNRFLTRLNRLDQRIDLFICRQPWGQLFLRIFGPISIASLSTVLILTWLCAIYLAERRAFSTAFAACQWDRWETWPHDAHPHHVAFVADPQLVDPHTYPGRPWPLSSLTITYADQYMRRAYSQIIDQLDPDNVLFLGDLFDGGREWSTETTTSPSKRWRRYGDEYWHNEFLRFGRIFFDPLAQPRPGDGTRPGRKVIASLPGNHDLGFSIGIQKPVRDRFSAFFGEGNRVDVIGNHTFVSVDTVSLSAADSQYPKKTAEVWQPAMEFLDDVSVTQAAEIKRELSWWFDLRQEPDKFIHDVVNVSDSTAGTPALSAHAILSNIKLPSVLLSHVPLYREPGTPCGPLRERHPPAKGNPKIDHRNAIAVRGGYQYQNVLTPDMSRLIADKVRDLKYAFSGDDHDYCEVLHESYRSSGLGIREITVKSISWAMGVRRPGFVLASLWNPLREENGVPLPNQDTSVKDTMQVYLCLLPDQLGIFIRYALLLLVSLLAVGTKAFVDTQRSTRINFYYGNPSFSSPAGFVSSAQAARRGHGKRADSDDEGGGNAHRGDVHDDDDDDDDYDHGADLDIDDLEAGLVIGVPTVSGPGSLTRPEFGLSTTAAAAASTATLRPGSSRPDGARLSPRPSYSLHPRRSADPASSSSPLPWPTTSTTPSKRSFGDGIDGSRTRNARSFRPGEVELPDPEVWWTRFRCGVAQVAVVVLPIYFCVIARW